MANERTILLQGDNGQQHAEAVANEALHPGHLLMKLSTGKVAKNTLATGNVPIYVAKEDAYQGKTIDDAFAVNDVVPYHIAQKGDVLRLRVPPSAAAIVIGDRLEFVTGGRVQKLNTGVAGFVAEEAVDNSGNAVSEAFVNARVI